ncbi:MAG: PAS domain-containing sensor histidine kinase, partial [Terriglobia bacterium]
VIRTHPLVVYGGLVSKNPYYVPPEEFLKPNQAALEVKRLLKNILEGEQARQTLRRSEERWRSVFENSAIGVALTDLNGRFLAANPVYQKLVGYTEEELRALSFLDITHEDYREANRALVTELLEGKRKQFQIEKKYRRKDGSLIWISNNVSLVPGAERVARFIMALSEDISDRKKAEEEHRNSEERWRGVFENSAVGIALSDPSSTRFQGANLAFQKMVGYTEDELRALSFMDITFEDDREASQRLMAELVEGRRQSFNIQKRYRRKDGNLIWANIQVSMVPGTQSIPQFDLAIIEDTTERKRAEEDLRRSLAQLRALAARLQRIREEERTKVAREIHDELGQALTGIKLDLSSLARELPADKKPRAEAVLTLVDETIQSVRRISTDLRPAILDAVGLVAAIEWAAEEFETRTGIKCRLDLPQNEIVIDGEQATALFRIFQETLTNVARHANATEVSARLTRENNSLTLKIHDNGMGISKDRLSTGSSLGILGMRERTLLLGGELTISGTPGKGTTVRVRIPQTRRAPSEDGN